LGEEGGASVGGVCREAALGRWGEEGSSEGGKR